MNKPRIASSLLRWGERPGPDSLSEPVGGTKPAHTLTSDSWPPQLGYNQLLLLKPRSVCYFVISPSLHLQTKRKSISNFPCYWKHFPNIILITYTMPLGGYSPAYLTRFGTSFSSCNQYKAGSTGLTLLLIIITLFSYYFLQIDFLKWNDWVKSCIFP